jgi:hypothetical protein
MKPITAMTARITGVQRAKVRVCDVAGGWDARIVGEVDANAELFKQKGQGG